MNDPYWSISVEVNGEQVVLLTPYAVGGKNLSEEERQIIRRAVRNLAAFVGCEELEHD